MFLLACDSQQSAETYFHNGDYESAVSIWQNRAQQSDQYAQQKLGMMYYLGLGVDRDFNQAFHWYRLAAQAGNPQAQWNVGSMYASGLGVETDLILAYGWFYQAQQSGNKQAEDYMEYLGGKITPNQIMKAKQIIAAELNQSD